MSSLPDYLYTEIFTNLSLTDLLKIRRGSQELTDIIDKVAKPLICAVLIAKHRERKGLRRKQEIVYSWIEYGVDEVVLPANLQITFFGKFIDGKTDSF